MGKGKIEKSDFKKVYLKLTFCKRKIVIGNKSLMNVSYKVD